MLGRINLNGLGDSHYCGTSAMCDQRLNLYAAAYIYAAVFWTQAMLEQRKFFLMLSLLRRPGASLHVNISMHGVDLDLPIAVTERLSKPDHAHILLYTESRHGMVVSTFSSRRQFDL
jgi:hypothetical protein